MLRQARRAAKPRPLLPAGWLSNPFGQRPRQVCADARALRWRRPRGLLFSSLCLQWVDDLGAVFAGFRRVLRPGGLLLVSTFGPETLWELRDAFATADAAPHVSPFADIAGFGDALVRAGFRQPVIDRDLDITRYADLAALMRELRAIGATNALASRRHTLTGRARFAAAARAYDLMRGQDGLLPASWETISALAWAPEAGVPIREGGGELASIPLSRIPIRRR